MNKMQALNAFWNGFNLKAYDENSVPDGTQMPYITYEASSDDFGNEIPQSASLWYRSESWEDISLKEQEISAFIGKGGRMVPYDAPVGYLDGRLLYAKSAFWIRKGSPWAQRMGDSTDENIRRIVLNINIEFLD